MRKIPNPSDFKAAFCRRTYCNQKQIGGIFIAKLVVAEKPSVAMSYAKVLGATSRKDGYLEGNGYLVSWCVGHLVELAPPNVYDAKYVKWSIADLPILPQKWQYLVSASTKKQFGILQKLMHRPDVESIVNSCDAGREGELIFRLVYQQAGCKKPFSRLWLSSMEENAIREGFAHLKPSTEYDALYNAALCRERADWMVGINTSRLFSCLYGQPLAVGRVMTPVLAMTVVREAAIAAFVPEKFYTVELELTSGCTASSRRIPEKTVAENLLEACRKEMVVTIQRITRKEKSENPPPLYDLTTLQRDANRLLGYSAQQTLDYVQSLYEKKLTTYPRTDSCYIKHIVTQASIDGKKVLVQADRAKTKSSLRTLPLVPPIRDRLLMLKGQQETYRRLCGKSYNRDYLGYLCVDEIGNIIRPNYVSEQFPKLLEKNGLRPIRFHDLRHSCASLLLANGVPMKQIQEWLGHSDFSTTANIYAHLDYASKLSSAQAMLEGLGYGNASA